MFGNQPKNNSNYHLVIVIDEKEINNKFETLRETMLGTRKVRISRQVSLRFRHQPVSTRDENMSVKKCQMMFFCSSMTYQQWK